MESVKTKLPPPKIATKEVQASLKIFCLGDALEYLRTEKHLKGMGITLSHAETKEELASKAGKGSHYLIIMGKSNFPTANIPANYRTMSDLKSLLDEKKVDYTLLPDYSDANRSLLGVFKKQGIKINKKISFPAHLLATLAVKNNL